MGLTVAQFDGAAEFYVERLEDFGAVLADEEYLKVCHLKPSSNPPLIHRFLECSSRRVQFS